MPLRHMRWQLGSRTILYPKELTSTVIQCGFRRLQEMHSIFTFEGGGTVLVDTAILLSIQGKTRTIYQHAASDGLRKRSAFRPRSILVEPINIFRGCILTNAIGLRSE